MTIAIEVSPNPYCAMGKWCEHLPYSVRVPHHLSGFELVPCMDGDQPCYDKSALLESLLHHAGVTDFDTVADYPKDDNTLRFMFRTFIDAEKASHVFNLINAIQGDK